MNIDIIMYSIAGVLAYIACMFFFIIGLIYSSKHEINLFLKDDCHIYNDDIIILGIFGQSY